MPLFPTRFWAKTATNEAFLFASKANMASFLCSRKDVIRKRKRESTPNAEGKQSMHFLSPKCLSATSPLSSSSFSIPFFHPHPSQIYLVQRQLDHHLALARVLKVACLDDLGGRAGVEAAAASPAKAATAATAAAAAKRRSASSAAGGEASSAPASSAAREASAASTAIHSVSLVG